MLQTFGEFSSFHLVVEDSNWNFNFLALETFGKLFPLFLQVVLAACVPSSSRGKLILASSMYSEVLNQVFTSCWDMHGCLSKKFKVYVSFCMKCFLLRICDLHVEFKASFEVPYVC